MKNKFLLFTGLALLTAPLLIYEKAHAYSSADGADPDHSGFGNGQGTNLQGDVETKGIKKSTVAGASEALVSGLVVAYDQTGDDGYTVTRAVTQSIVGQKRLACVTVDVVATSDTSYHRCITKGFARVQYNADNARPIEDGRNACVNAAGVVRGCYLSDPEATANTGIIPLESKANGTGTDLKVMIDLK